MLPDSLTDWRAPILALLLALGWSALLRRRGPLAELGFAIGLLAGWALTRGVALEWPRTMPARLMPLLAGGTILGVAAVLLRGRWAAALLGGVAALAGGWWLAGAPLSWAEVPRTLPLGLAAALLVALLLTDTAPRFLAPAAALLATTLVVLAAPPGPWVMLALVVLAAAAGALPAGWAPGMALRIPLALGLAALALGPVVARGAPLDWLAALALPGALLLAPRLAGRAGPALAFAALAVPAALLAWGLR